MKNVKNKRHFALGLITSVIAVACFALFVLQGQSVRFVITGVISAALAAISFSYAYSKRGVVEEIQKCMDERDLYIAMKSCQTTIQILNYILLGGCFLALVLYGTLRLSMLLVIAVTLCCVLILMFLVTLLVNHYYENRE